MSEAPASQITLGEHTFDPLATTDFRLVVEGASKTGKSNTLAVILEDLADVTIPTLIIERLGILTPVRQVDDDLVVVGAREEPGIDLVLPLEQVDLVADLVLERGWKVLVDVSTYADLDEDPDRHTEHAAVASALKALNDRAQARLRAGNRRKALVIIDEAHVLVPENNAPHIDLDDDVRRARAQIVKLATEGGNKGLTLIAAYQRRAYVSKAVVSQTDNFVVHRLHATDRKGVAREIGVDPEEIEALGTGEVLVYGDFTNQRVVGPTAVRRRTSPDPREESFEVPDPPAELSAALEELRGEIDQRQERQHERRDRIEELEEQVERLQEQNADLREQADVSERIARALETLQEGGPAMAGAEADLVEELEDLRERNDRLETDLAEAREDLEAAEAEIRERETRIEELETELAEYREMDVVRDEVVSAARTILRQLGAADPDVEDAREELADLRERNRDLEAHLEELQAELERARAEGVETPPAFEDALSFLRHEAVQGVVGRAVAQTTLSADHAWDILFHLADDAVEQAHPNDLTPVVDIHTSNIRKLLNRLAEKDVVESVSDGRRKEFRLNVAGLERIIQNHRKREEMAQFRAELGDSG
jgi:peptidoglycan hydrolase CwlO-like protein/predicted transcriptional regulator